MNAQYASGAPRLKGLACATAVFLAVALSAGVIHAQVLTPVPALSSGSGAAGAIDPGTAEVDLLVGRSTLLNLGTSITRVSLTSPEVADAMVTSPNQLLIHGKQPGTISMFVWDRAGGIRRYEVVVRRDLSELVVQMQQLFPGEPISIHSNGSDVVISGTVTSKYVVDKAAEVAAGYVEKKEDVVNLLKQQEGIASNQVLLRVRFAEVSRSAMTELGASFFANGTKDGRWFGRTATQQFPAPDFEDDKLVFSDFLNLFLFDAKNAIGGAIRLLKNKGLFQSLAEPNLIAENGKEASFLAGGEYPYPVVQGGGDRTAVTIQFKEFGVKLNFTPTIVGDNLVKLKVRPEVSSLDFSNAVIVEGFRIPAISTRRTETEVELQDGQTFAIAGLMNNTVTEQMQKIPGIGDIPILGRLFQSKAAQKNQTELVVMITPTILRRNSTGVSPRLPDPIEPYLGPPSKTVPNPAPWNPGAQGQTSAEPVAPAAQPAASPSTPVMAQTPHVAPEPLPVAAVRPVPPPPIDRKAAERARKAEEKRREEAEKLAKAERKKAERMAKLEKERREKEREQAEKMAKLEKKRLEKERKEAEEAAKEQAKLQKEIDRRAAEAAARQAEIDRKHAEELAEAQEKLAEAQKEYRQQLAKARGEND